MMMKTPIAAAAAACKVWSRSTTSPCVFGRSVFESLRTKDGERIIDDITSTVSQLPQSYHCDRMLVDFEEKEDGSVVLTPPTNEEERRKVTTERSNTRKYGGIPLGRARDCPTLTPRAFDDDRFDRRRRPFVSLAVVGMVVLTEEEEDSSSSLLITRRPSYMRSFPGAFVFPGGNVDADDESLEHALSREIFEEAGLKVSEDSWKLVCLWESIYPTHLPPLEEEETTIATDGNEEKVQNDGAIKAHHLVCYFSGRPQNQEKTNTRLNLCEEEVDGAVRMSPNNIRDLLLTTSQIEADVDRSIPETIKDQIVALETNSSARASGEGILLSDLAGIYPRFDKSNNRFCGMAQGSLFALEEFVRNDSTTQIASKL